MKRKIVVHFEEMPPYTDPHQYRNRKMIRENSLNYDLGDPDQTDCWDVDAWGDNDGFWTF